MSQPSSVVLYTHNSDIMTRINSLLGSQTSPVVLCMQNSVISTRKSSLYWSQTSPVVLCMQTNVIIIIITGFCMQNSDFRTRIASLYVSEPSSVVLAFKTATLAPELQVSMGPNPHLWFWHSKQRFKDQNYKSLWVPDLTYGFLHSKQRL